MPIPWYIVLAILAVGLLLVVLPVVVDAVLRFRGKRVIVCPETRAPATVDVDAAHAGLSAALGEPKLRLSDCSRWPERAECGQECLAQIASSPEQCLVRNILADWYAGKACALCGRQFGLIHWAEHRPALLGPERRMQGWDEIEAERLYDTLQTCLPVCWSCHLTETMIREHPERIVDRGRTTPSPRA